jgi:uroporphyrinogen decarboxylase
MSSEHTPIKETSTITTITSRQRVLAALSHKQPDRVPMDLGSTIVTGISIQAYDRLKDALNFHLGKTQVYDHEAQLAVVDEQVLQRLKIDTRGVKLGMSKQRSTIEADKHGIWDEWGFWRKRSPDTGTYFIVKGPLEGDITTNDILKHPTPDPYDPARISGLRAKILDMRAKGDCAIMLSLPANFILTSMELRGFEDWYIDSSANQHLLGFLMDHVLEIQMAMCDNILTEVGNIIDIAVNFDDLAMQDRLMVSPRIYSSLLEPRLIKLYQRIKSKTAAKILHHSDGAIKPILASLIDIGVDAINPLQVSAKGMDDLEGLKKEFGNDLSFWGGIDTQHLLPNATPEEIRSSVLRTINILNKDGGYVLCPVHNVQKDVPPQNVLAMYDTVINT